MSWIGFDHRPMIEQVPFTKAGGDAFQQATFLRPHVDVSAGWRTILSGSTSRDLRQAGGAGGKLTD